MNINTVKMRDNIFNRLVRVRYRYVVGFCLLFYSKLALAQVAAPIYDSIPTKVSTGQFQKKVTLPDSTEVFLNYHSSFNYDTNRNITGVQGELFFKVKEGPQPFAVFFDHFRIVCDGPATFNVNAFYQDEMISSKRWRDQLSLSIRVTLFQGKASVWEYPKIWQLKKREPFTISPMKVVIGEMEGSECDSSWMSGRYHFESVPARWLAVLCKRFYGITLKLGRDSEDLTFQDFGFSVKAPFDIFLRNLAGFNKRYFVKKSQTLYMVVSERELQSVAPGKETTSVK